MTTQTINRFFIFFIFILSAFGPPFLDAKEKSNSSTADEIKSYCIDFNWGLGRKAGFAKPGKWADADPKEHIDWYKSIGANVIQTFAVSCNGSAWYKSDTIPEQPGLKHDFLTEMVRLGHAEGMKVMGYFCIAANQRWGEANPTLSYGTPSGYHIPYTDEYLAYLSSAITDAIKTTGMDGFMIDWVWMPKREATKGKWLDAEKNLYQQLMGEPFPGEENMTKQKNIAYGRKAIDRCWETIRKAAKSSDPDCIIWLTVNSTKSPYVSNSKMFKEVDWLMGESGNLQDILKLKPMIGDHTRLISCMSDFGGPDAVKSVPEAIAAGVGLYGYAKPSDRSSTIDLEKIFPNQITQLRGNSKRIAVLARVNRGLSMDSVWRNGKFAEPENLPPFRIKLRKRSSRHQADLARLDFEGNKATIHLTSPYHKGRAEISRVGAKWPSTIVVRLKREKIDRPYATGFRVANGVLGVGIFQKDKVEVVAGKMTGGIELEKLWRTDFLNAGNPKSPVKAGAVFASRTDEFVEFVVPDIILKTNPPVITFEWGIDGKVF